MDFDAFAIEMRKHKQSVEERFTALYRVLETRPQQTVSPVTHDHIAALNDRIRELEGKVSVEALQRGVVDAFAAVRHDLDDLRAAVELLAKPAEPDPTQAPEPQQEPVSSEPQESPEPSPDAPRPSLDLPEGIVEGSGPNATAQEEGA